MDHRTEALNMVSDPDDADYNPQEALVHAVLHLASVIEAMDKNITSSRRGSMKYVDRHVIEDDGSCQSPACFCDASDPTKWEPRQESEWDGVHIPVPFGTGCPCGCGTD